MRSEAEAEHRKAVKLAPKNAAYLNNLGFSLYLRQHFKEAITVYESAARLAPLSRRVRTNLGFACAAVGDLRRAAREFQMGGTEAEAKNNLGFAYERRGDMANAYDLYVEAVRLDPKGERARSNLVHAAIVLGRPVPPEAAAPPAQPPAAEAVKTVPVPSDAPTAGGAPVTKTRLWLLSMAFIGSAISVGACGRAHLSSNYGQSYTAWFGAQQVNKKATHPEESRRIIESLDAQEAGAVSKSYRRGTSKGGEEAQLAHADDRDDAPGRRRRGLHAAASVPQ